MITFQSTDASDYQPIHHSLEPDEELDERIEHDARHSGQKPAELRRRLEQSGGPETLISQLLREKSLDLIKTSANISIEE